MLPENSNWKIGFLYLFIFWLNEARASNKNIFHNKQNKYVDPTLRTKSRKKKIKTVNK
jgi:hypothetical protein